MHRQRKDCVQSLGHSRSYIAQRLRRQWHAACSDAKVRLVTARLLMLTRPNPTLPLRARPWSAGGLLGGLLRRFFALCLAATVLTATLGAGRAYLWCSMMQERVETCCCEPGQTADEGHTGPELRSGCCESKPSALLGTGITASKELEVPASLPAMCALQTKPALPTVERSPRRAPEASLGSRERPIRAGPCGASEVCVRLQVFRC
jgi:hypothetical protein